MEQKYVAYYRVSTQQQGRSGLGLEAQRVEVAKKTTDGTVIAEFTEIESGKKADRPQFAAAKELAKKTGATLVIAKLDRLSRDVHFISGFIKDNVPFIACDLQHANKFTLHIMAAVAEQERDFISERTKAALAAAKVRGVQLGTNAVVLNHRRSTAADAYAVQLAATIRTMQADGLLKAQAIANALNERGITTITGSTWGAGQVVRLLRRLS